MLGGTYFSLMRSFLSICTLHVLLATHSFLLEPCYQRFLKYQRVAIVYDYYMRNCYQTHAHGNVERGVQNDYISKNHNDYKGKIMIILMM